MLVKHSNSARANDAKQRFRTSPLFRDFAKYGRQRYHIETRGRKRQVGGIALCISDVSQTGSFQLPTGFRKHLDLKIE